MSLAGLTPCLQRYGWLRPRSSARSPCRRGGSRAPLPFIPTPAPCSQASPGGEADLTEKWVFFWPGYFSTPWAGRGAAAGRAAEGGRKTRLLGPKETVAPGCGSLSGSAPGALLQGTDLVPVLRKEKGCSNPSPWGGSTVTPARPEPGCPWGETERPGGAERLRRPRQAMGAPVPAAVALVLARRGYNLVFYGFSALLFFISKLYPPSFR